ncbi:hypothetical protein JGU66_26305 [Myxococcaceae bacterium JPH2]|nr:hypothetical protein [Myxococcaceae bacterium JPH2]
MNFRSPALLAAALLCGAGCTVKDASDPCSPNPCRDANRGQCVVESNEARCLCDTGFVARPNGTCEPVSAANCAEHFGDAAEPDDCQARARTLAPGSAVHQQTIEPIGDFDFFRVDGQLGHIYSVTVKPSGSLMPRVDAFDQGGQYLGTHESTGQAVLGFKARSAAPYFLRVSHSPVDISAAVGAYALTLTDVGMDDHGDLPSEATSLTPDSFDTTSPQDHFGRFEYQYDDDWFRFSASSTRHYRITFQGPQDRVLPVVAVFGNGDTKNPLFTEQNPTIDFTVPTSGTVYLRMYLPSGQGSYGFHIYEG